MSFVQFDSGIGVPETAIRKIVPDFRVHMIKTLVALSEDGDEPTLDVVTKFAVDFSWNVELAEGEVIGDVSRGMEVLSETNSSLKDAKLFTTDYTIVDGDDNETRLSKKKKMAEKENATNLVHKVYRMHKAILGIRRGEMSVADDSATPGFDAPIPMETKYSLDELMMRFDVRAKVLNDFLSDVSVLGTKSFHHTTKIGRNKSSDEPVDSIFKLLDLLAREEIPYDAEVIRRLGTLPLKKM